MKEEWRKIDEYPHLEFSNLGNVRSIDRYVIKKMSGKEMKPMFVRGQPIIAHISVGYRYVNFFGKHIRLHRLIAQAFIPNPENKRCVNHKDGNKLNNHIDNLEWMTSSENNQHAYDTGLRRPPWTGKYGYEHHRSKPVIAIKDLAITEYGSIAEASRGLGIPFGRAWKLIKYPNRHINGTKLYAAW